LLVLRIERHHNSVALLRLPNEEGILKRKFLLVEFEQKVEQFMAIGLFLPDCSNAIKMQREELIVRPANVSGY